MSTLLCWIFCLYFEDHWNNDWESFTEQWELADWTRELPVATAAVVPWDAMVACSLHFTFEDLLAEQLISGERRRKSLRTCLYC